MKVVGPYRLKVALGTGGMAEVWLATHGETERSVALKLLKVSSPELFREARAHARLKHEHIVQLYDYGEEEEPFLSMECMDGSLRDLLPLDSYEQVRNVLLAVLSALAFAHARGVIHRDIKPENILFRREGSELAFKLADFGIAHALGESSLNQDIRASAGTPLYMAPEQFYGDWRDLGPWTDLYAVGCLAFELITGHVPFQGSNLAQLAFKHLQEPVPRNVPTLFPVPTEIWTFIELLSRKKAGERVGHAADAIAFLPDLDPEIQRLSDHSSEILPVHQVLWTQDTQDIALIQTEPSVPIISEPPPTTTSVNRPIKSHIPPLEWSGPVYHPAELDTDGLGLFALREIPVVGLDHQRDAIWRAIGQMCCKRTSGGVWLPSENQDTAWRLAQRVSTHAAQIGAVQVFEIEASPTGGVRESFVGLAESLLRAWRTNPDDLMRRARTFGTNGETLGREILGRVHGQPDMLPGRTGKFAAAADLLCEFAELRPVVLLMRGVEYDEDLLEWLDLLLNHNSPLLVLICGEPIRVLDKVQVLEIPGIDGGSAHKMLRAMLPFSDSLTAEIASISGQDAEFAHQMVSDLVDRRSLKVELNRLTLPADELLPTTPEELFMRRLDRVLRAMGHDAMTSEVALEIAAALGTAPELDELAAICKIAKVHYPDRLIRKMLDGGLLSGDETRWYFGHASLLGCLKQRAADRGRWTTWHLMCAEHLLASAQPDMPSEFWSRIGRHFVDAGEARRALWPMYRAVTQQTGSLPTAKLLLFRRQEVLSNAGIEETEPDAVLQKHLHATMLNHEGQAALSFKYLEIAIDDCRREGHVLPGYEFAYAEILKSLGTMMIETNPAAAVVPLEEAEQIFMSLGLELEAASCTYGLGFIAMKRRSQLEAEVLYHKAAEVFRRAGSRRRLAQILSYLAHCLTIQNRHQEAADVLLESVALARQLHDRYSEFLAESAHSTMLRHLDDYEGARTHAKSALSLANGLSAQELAVATYNLVVLNLVDRAKEQIEKIEQLLEFYASCGMKNRLPIVEFALRVAKEESVSNIPDLPLDDPEIVWLSKIRASQGQHTESL